MTKPVNVVLILLHEVEEYDQVRLLTGLGYNVFAFSNPHEGGSLRPGIPTAPRFPALEQACWQRRHDHRDDPYTVNGRAVIDWAKYDLPQEVLDWADVIICHHAEHTFLVPQWARLKASGKRVIWRTVGQSTEGNERMMAPLRAEGLEIVRYSPKEASIPGFAGQDALIRFYKDPAEYGPWIGDVPAVINITQDLLRRSLEDNGSPKPPGQEWTNYSYWREATKGLPAIAMGPGSEAINGTGALSFEEMKEMLRRGRAYLYTGTQPASYTLGLIEAMMSGIPVVSIAPQWMRIFPYGPDLFEGHEIALNGYAIPADAHDVLKLILTDADIAHRQSEATRARAIELFGMDTIGAQWRDYLG